MCLGFNKTLECTHPPSHNTDATTALLFLAILLFMCDPEVRSKNTAHTLVPTDIFHLKCLYLDFRCMGRKCVNRDIHEILEYFFCGVYHNSKFIYLADTNNQPDLWVQQKSKALHHESDWTFLRSFYLLHNVTGF
jgi:hypothetical protein